MGWFLSKNTKREGGAKSKGGGRGKRGGKSGGRGGGASSRSKAHGDIELWNARRTWAAVKVLLVIALVLGGAMTWRWGERTLVRYATAHHPMKTTPRDVVLAGAPPWMSRAVRMQLADVVAQPFRGHTDPLDAQAVHQAAQRLGQVAWVRHVEQVRRLPGDKIEVRAQYRQPVAVVQARDGYHLVDAYGTLLPGLYFHQQVAKLDLPLVTGVSNAPPGQPGRHWRGYELPGALSLIHLLHNQPWADQITAYDVSHRDRMGRLRLVVHTKHGRIRWGLPPGDEHAIEPDAATKVHWLDQLAATRGGIDAGGRVVDVYSTGSIEIGQPAGQRAYGPTQ